MRFRKKIFEKSSTKLLRNISGTFFLSSHLYYCEFKLQPFPWGFPGSFHFFFSFQFQKYIRLFLYKFFFRFIFSRIPFFLGVPSIIFHNFLQTSSNIFCFLQTSSNIFSRTLSENIVRESFFNNLTNFLWICFGYSSRNFYFFNYYYNYYKTVSGDLFLNLFGKLLEKGTGTIFP